MKMPWRCLFLLLALLTAAALIPSPSYAGVSVDVGLFYDDLAPHGDWIQMESYGWVWTPRHVAADWRPYSRGHWVLTVDDGWLWVSDEDWGWATCHYGRWFFDETYGWVWVPGHEWAPAWVSWRTGGGYIGWAPLAPEFRWNAAVGFRVGDVNLDVLIAPSRYVFVPEEHFLDARVFRRAVPVSQNVIVVRNTRNVTRYAVVNHHPVNLGVDVGQVERGAHHAVPRVRVVEETSQRGVSRGSSGSSTVRVFRPEVHEVKGRTPPGASARASVRPRPVEPRVPQVAPPRAERSVGSSPRNHRSDRDSRVAEDAQREQARRREPAVGRVTDATRPAKEGPDTQTLQRAQQAARAAQAREADKARQRQEAQAREQQKHEQAQAREKQKRDERARREEKKRQQRTEQAHQKQQEQERRRAQEQARKKPAQGESEKS